DFVASVEAMIQAHGELVEIESACARRDEILSASAIGIGIKRQQSRALRAPARPVNAIFSEWEVAVEWIANDRRRSTEIAAFHCRRGHIGESCFLLAAILVLPAHEEKGSIL